MTVKRISRLLVILLIALLIVPVLSTAPVEATRSCKTHLQIKTHVADVLYAGTDSGIYFKVYYVDGKHDSFHLDKSNYNDFERNDWDTYHVDIPYPQWYVSSFGLSNSGSDGMCLAYISVSMWDPNEADVKSVFTSSEPGSKWLEKSEHKFNASSTARVLTWDSYKTFKEAFARQVYLTADSQNGMTSVTWNPTVNGDGYNKNANSTYDPYTLSDPPLMSVQVQAINSGNNWVNALSNRFV